MSRVVAVAMCKDEADVVEGWARHLADEVDHILVADNMSTDGSREILEKLARDLPLTVLYDDEVAYYQSRKVSALAEEAATKYGADWVVAADLDELWFARGDRISIVLGELSPMYRRVHATLYHHFRTRFDDPPGDDPFRTMPWRQVDPAGTTPQRPGGLPKVAFRWEPGAVVEAGNHSVDLPSRRAELPPPTHLLEVRHFPYRSPAQMIRKARQGAAAYAATDLPEQTGAHWRSYGRILDQPNGEQLLTGVYDEWYNFLSPTDAGLIYDPAPYRRWEQTGDD